MGITAPILPQVTFPPTWREYAAIAHALCTRFVQQENVKVAGVTTDAALAALTVTQKQTTRSYIDGLGRNIQSIGVQASPLQNDLIQPMAYDALGRPVAGYLPYAGKSTDTIGRYRPNAVTTDQPGFYNQTTQYIIPVDTAPHANALYENTPLQRLLKSGVAGTGYQPEDSGTQHYKTLIHRYNKSATDGNILIWNHDGTFTASNYYADNTLVVEDAKGEDNVETLIFSDEAGHVILKRQILSPANLDTYYIYNWAGMPMYIVPPAATAVLSANSYSLTTSPLVNMVFYYTYDSMGRIVSRKVPAKGTMYVIYDPMNRPVLTQDANMAANNQWDFVKYDVKGRAIETGIYTDSNTGRTTPSGMQSYVNGVSYTTWYERRNATNTGGGYYTSTVFPVSGTNMTLTPLSFSYYDDYFMTEQGSPDFSYSSQGLAGEETQTTAQVKDMPTMTSMTTVGGGLSNTWLTKVIFYDKRLNPIQTQSNNHLYYVAQTTMTDYATTVPDFTGVPQSTYVTKKSTSSTTIQVLTKFTYDHMYRVLNVSQAYNAGPTGTTTQVAAYAYNELGQVIKKSLGYVNSTTWLQNVEMRYNIRWQLMNINNSKLTPDGGVTMGSTNTNAVFGATYTYDTPDSNLGGTASYDGKISSVKWMSVDGSGTKSYERAYKYSYDGVNRYTAATYAERTTTGTGSFNNNLDGFDESGITYDLNGNIKTLNRNSSTQGTNSNIQVDNLAYTYNTSIPDQLSKVTDGTGANYTGYGFRNLTGAGSTSTYAYDNNGNLTADPYKGLTISYDYLNRTDKVTVTTGTNQYIYYTYDATGNLIRKQVYGSTTMVQTDYVDGFVYITQSGTMALSYFPMPEGRVLNTGSGSTVTLTQEYMITDQQGNARVSFKNNGSGAAVVTQENSYYGFGLILANSPVGTTGTSNKKLYNGGSEWQNDYSNLPDYQQTFFRNYDAALGRWVGADPMADYTPSKTAYNYAGNNPIMFNDPLGNLRRYTPPAMGGGSSGSDLDQLRADLNAEDKLYADAFDMAYGGGAAISDDVTDQYVGQGPVVGYLDTDADPSTNNAFTVSKDGKISPYNATYTPADGQQQSMDILFASSNQGDPDLKNFTTVDPGILESPQSANYDNADITFYQFQHTANSSSLFEFLARNTNVEWSMVNYMDGKTEWSYLGRDNNGNRSGTSSASFEYLLNNVLDNQIKGNWQLIDAGHDHPDGNSTHGPSGYMPNEIYTLQGGGDIQVAKAYETSPLLQNIKINFWIFDASPTYGGYFQYNGNSNYDTQKIVGPFSTYGQMTNQ